MSFASPNRDEMGLARIICEAMVIILIAMEPVKNPYLQKFVRTLLAAFILEESVIIAEVFVVHIGLFDEWTAIIWRIYEIIRIYISLSLCYPISLFIGENGQKLQRVFFVVCCLVVTGTISDYLRYNDGHSGMNYIAFTLIFLFTLYQYTQLRRQTQGEIPRLKTLMILESTLLVLNIILVLLFFYGGYQQTFLSALKIAIGILQYHKLYMMILVLTYFD